MNCGINYLNQLLLKVPNFKYLNNYWREDESLTENELLEKIVYVCQQGTNHFKENIPEEVVSFWVSKFSKSSKEPRYKVFVLNSLCDLNIETLGLTSSTYDINVTKHF